MSPTTILVVDDLPDVRGLLRRLLTARGYNVIEASNGIDAVALARRSRPDLILLDLGLPGCDGWEVARQVRADPALEETPMIAMTGYGTMSALRAAKMAGCQSVLFKPFDLALLEQQIQDTIAKSKRVEQPGLIDFGDYWQLRPYA